MTDFSNVKARLHRLPLRTIIALSWRLKLARLFLWLARVTDRYDGAAHANVLAHRRERRAMRPQVGSFAENAEAVTYDRAAIMRDAHKRFRDGKRLGLGWTFGQCLATAWKAAKDRRKATARRFAAYALSATFCRATTAPKTASPERPEPGCTAGFFVYPAPLEPVRRMMQSS